MVVSGIFGPKKSGKTTLASALCEEYWAKEGRASLVYDPNGAHWPACCWVTQDRGEFEFAVQKMRSCLIVLEEALTSVGRDPDLAPLFNRGNHYGHKVLVVGHSGTNLLPSMREQFDEVYLFKQSPKAARYWYEIFPNEKILKTVYLSQYEFLRVRAFKEPERMMLTLGEKGVSPHNDKGTASAVPNENLEPK